MWALAGIKLDILISHSIGLTVGQLEERQLRSGFMVGDSVDSLGLEFKGSSGVIKTWRVMLGSERVGWRNVRVLLRMVEEYFLMGLVGGKRSVGTELFPSSSDNE